jgi:acyl-CoA synthetase (AMP-forming)/AMP-acid ligase II
MSFNIADLFESVADAVPERTAMVSTERRLSYRELDERATRLANYWASRGIGHGYHIGLQLRNCTEYIEAMLAAYKLPRDVVCVDEIKRSPAGKADYPWAQATAQNALA